MCIIVLCILIFDLIKYVIIIQFITHYVNYNNINLSISNMKN